MDLLLTVYLIKSTFSKVFEGFFFNLKLAFEFVPQHTEVYVFMLTEGESYFEVCDEGPMGVWRSCPRLCSGPDNLCSLSQVDVYTYLVYSFKYLHIF